jgi:hypothetical protein
LSFYNYQPFLKVPTHKVSNCDDKCINLETIKVLNCDDKGINLETQKVSNYNNKSIKLKTKKVSNCDDKGINLQDEKVLNYSNQITYKYNSYNNKNKDILKRLMELKTTNKSYKEISDILNTEKYFTTRGGYITKSVVQNLLRHIQ